MQARCSSEVSTNYHLKWCIPEDYNLKQQCCEYFRCGYFIVFCLTAHLIARQTCYNSGNFQMKCFCWWSGLLYAEY